MIRHGRRGGPPTEPIFPLPVAVIQPPFFAALVPPIGTAPLPKAGLPAAVLAAIAVASITVGADEEDGVAERRATGPQQENALAVSGSRHCRLAVLDNGGLVVSGWNLFGWSTLFFEAYRLGTLPRHRQGSSSRLLTRYSLPAPG